MNRWIQGSRPKTLFASMGPVCLGLSLSYFLHQEIDFRVGFNTLLCAIFLQIGTNFANDYYDAKSGLDHNRLGPERITQSKKVTPREMKKAMAFIFIIIFFLGINLMIHGGWPIIIIGLSSMFFAWAYTGGPFPLSRYALGEVFAFIFFGPIPVWGTYFLQTLNHSPDALLLGAGPGLLSSALMAINNLRDRENDGEKGKKTLAVFLPFPLARLLPLFFILLGLTIPLLFIYKGFSSYLFLVLLTPLLFFNTWKKILTEKPSAKFNLYLANMGKCLFLYCLTFSFVLILSQR